MPRRSRIYIDGVPLHIVQRGHNREPCFFSDDDCHAYLHWLDEALAACRCTLHGYVRMTNHVHLLLTPAEARLVPRLLISLGRRYVQYINRSDRRTGTLWDSRYKSSLVQEDAYLLACQRYIELNPVRARMVSDPTQHRWSSYRANAPTRWVTPRRGCRRCRSTGRWAPATRHARRLIADCSTRTSISPPSPISVWHSARISRWAARRSTQGSSS